MELEVALRYRITPLGGMQIIPHEMVIFKLETTIPIKINNRPMTISHLCQTILPMVSTKKALGMVAIVPSLYINNMISSASGVSFFRTFLREPHMRMLSMRLGEGCSWISIFAPMIGPLVFLSWKKHMLKSTSDISSAMTFIFGAREYVSKVFGRTFADVIRLTSVGMTDNSSYQVMSPTKWVLEQLEIS